jgi:hypothetical protein
VKDFTINGLADGDYAAFITSDQTIAASVRLPRSDKSKKPNTDFTWLQAAQQLTGSQQITVPPAGIGKLSLTNLTNKSAAVTINGALLNIEPQGIAVVKVAAGAVNVKIIDGKVGANLLIDVSGSVTNLALVDYRNSGSRVAVRVR